nr:hypothetical protein [Tanacetum cinerariifolium]
YHKLYDILKQHQHEVNEIRVVKIARVANPLVLVAQQQQVYHPQTHPTHYNQNSSTRTQQAATRNRGKASVNSPQLIYDQEPSMGDDDDDEKSKDKEIDKLMALISLSIHQNTGYESQMSGNVVGARETVGSSMVQKSGIQYYNCKEYRHVARECQKPKKAKDAAYHREKMLLLQTKLSAHQETISTLSKQKEAQIKLYKTRKDKEIEKVIELENKVKVLDNIVYKTGQSVQTMNILNNKCRTSFVKPEYLKKAKQANLRLYDIGCYNDNLALMLSPETDEVIRLEKESRSKLSDLVRPFDYAKLNSLYDLFVPQCEKLSEQRFFSDLSRISHINAQKEKRKESFQKQIIFLETRINESISGNKKGQSSFEIENIQRDINTIVTGV